MNSGADNVTEVLIVSGSVGAGKTALVLAIHDILSSREIPHACLDLDQFSYSWPAMGPYNMETVFAALEHVWPVYQASGIHKLILARVVETTAEIRRYADILQCSSLTVCRVTASEEVRKGRLNAREEGASLAWHLQRTGELERILEHAALEDFVIMNENEPIDRVAERTLRLAKWLS
jgi:hypothetical protein